MGPFHIPSYIISCILGVSIFRLETAFRNSPVSKYLLHTASAGEDGRVYGLLQVHGQPDLKPHRHEKDGAKPRSSQGNHVLIHGIMDKIYGRIGSTSLRGAVHNEIISYWLREIKTSLINHMVMW